MNTTTDLTPDVLAASASGRILIIDDTPANTKLLEDMLIYHGYQVEAAADGEAGLQLVRDWSPDLVLLDVMMPGLDGFEVCKRIRAEPAWAMVPVVMVTALDSREDRVRGLEAGADEFLSMPVNPPELRARVRSLLRIRHLYATVERQAAQLATWNRMLEARVREEVSHVERLSRLKRFFSPQLAELILAGGADDPLESHRRELTVVFLDLRGFASLGETADADEVMRALAEFHRAMGRRILEFQGTLERFTGDGMMVFFNDPLPIADPSRRAVEMAFALQEDALKLAARWNARGCALGVGVGIAQGYATVGAIGFDGRTDYGVIGHVSRVAQRLGQLAGAGDIVVSPRVLAEVKESVLPEELDEVAVEGLPRPIRPARLLDYRRNGE